MIKVVFIDIDNTLLSFSGYVKTAMREGFEKFGLKPYSDDMFYIFENVNNGLWRRIEQGTLAFDELIKLRWNAVFKELGIDFDGEVFEHYFRERLFTCAIPEPHAIELLEYLKGRYVLCVASNGPYEQQINRLRVGGMYDYFTHFFISEQVGASKPSKEYFDRCFDELRAAEFPSLTPDEVIIIGDSVSSDIAGGVSYGLHTCLYRKGEMPAADTGGAEHVVSSLDEVKTIL